MLHIWDKDIRRKFMYLKETMTDGLFVDELFYKILIQLVVYIQYQFHKQVREESNEVEHVAAVLEIEQFLESIGYVPHISTVEGILYCYVEALLRSVKLMGVDYTRKNLNRNWRHLFLTHTDQKRYDEVWED